MEFVNNGGPVKVRIGKINNFYWKTIKSKEVVELPQQHGTNLGFTPLPILTTGQLNGKLVETKQIETTESNSKASKSQYENELLKINGIGHKTVKDIMMYAPTRENLIQKINSKDGLPFRDDVELKLRKKYGK